MADKPLKESDAEATKPATASSGEDSGDSGGGGDDAAAKQYLDNMIKITKVVCPGSDETKLRQNLPHIFRAMVGANLTSLNQLAGIIATAYVETTTLEPISEWGGGGAYEGWCEGLGNCSPGDGDTYKGRGYIQLTGKANYKAATDVLNQDLIGNPDSAMEPETAAKTMVLYWTGKIGGKNCHTAAEKGDWPRVRLLVNGSSSGHNNDYSRTFKPCVDRALAEYPPEGLDPNLAGSIDLPGNYGLGCVDPGSAGSRTVGAGNPQTQADAMVRALGLHELDRQNAIMFDGILNPANYPEVLRLKPQTKFHTEGFGKNLDGEVTAKRIIYICGPSLEMRLRAAQPDPNAPAPQIFRHNTNQPLNTNSGVPTNPPPDGDALPVPYYTQRDHPTNPNGTCNSSTHAMALAFLTGKISSDDEYNEMRSRYGQSTDHAPHTSVFSDYGIQSHWSTTLGYKDLDEQLGKGIPMPIGIFHRGPETNPIRNFGHICLVIGKASNGAGYIIHDPFGSANNDYADGNGSNIVYSMVAMENRWLADGPNGGHGRVISKKP